MTGAQGPLSTHPAGLRTSNQGYREGSDELLHRLCLRLRMALLDIEERVLATMAHPDASTRLGTECGQHAHAICNLLIYSKDKPPRTD
eukprot:40420-Eustigmatos_ZCMA.PRE.1